MSLTEEIVDVVNEFDVVIGTAQKTDVYKTGLSNRIVHIFVIDSQTNKIFIQQRSEYVRYLPGYYCTSAGGHVGAGEEYIHAAQRELSEEIGINDPVIFVDKFIYSCPETVPPTPRFISLFISYTNEQISFVDGEVCGGVFLSLNEIEDLIPKFLGALPRGLRFGKFENLRFSNKISA